jgi:hypothetical protein
METAEEIQARQDAYRIAETTRREHETAMDKRRVKLELLRMARDTLVENARNKPAEEAGVTAAEITAFAQELTNYVGE